jgi:hypothetical protein
VLIAHRREEARLFRHHQARVQVAHLELQVDAAAHRAARRTHRHRHGQHFLRAADTEAGAASCSGASVSSASAKRCGVRPC